MIHLVSQIDPQIPGPLIRKAGILLPANDSFVSRTPMSASHLPLPRSAPETQRVSSEALLHLIEDLETQALELHSILLVRYGHVIAEGWWDPYRPEIPHKLFS